MDFGTYDLKRASEAGSWHHFTLEGQPMYADSENKAPKKPCRIRLHGMAHDEVTKAWRAYERLELMHRNRMVRLEDAEAEAAIEHYQEQLFSLADQLVLAAAFEWENINYDGKPLKLNAKNIVKICGAGTVFFEQVRDAIAESSRLFTNAATD